MTFPEACAVLDQVTFGLQRSNPWQFQLIDLERTGMLLQVRFEDPTNGEIQTGRKWFVSLHALGSLLGLASQRDFDHRD